MLGGWLKKHLDRLSHRFMLYLTIAIVAIMGFGYYWNISYQERQATMELHQKANVIALQFTSMRAFVAQHQERINTDSQGNFEFKHLNPAAVGKGVGDIFNFLTDYKIKQTRLTVRNPENTPDQYEVEMMSKLKADRSLQEVWSKEEVDGKRYFRYLIPLTMESWCLDCHGGPVGELDIAGYPKEGYYLGDFGGAISIMMPMESFYEAMRVTSLHYLIITGLLITSTLITTYGVMRHLVTDPLQRLGGMTKELGQGNLEVDMSSFHSYGEIKDLARDFDIMSTKLNELYHNLEYKVADRTRQLWETNQQLQEQQQVLFQLNQQLFRANKLQAEFLANMSHELRTPLTSIIAFTELMLEEAEEGENTGQIENLQDIGQSANQLLNLINDLLDMAKIEAGQMMVKLCPVELADVVANVENTLMPLATKKGILLENRTDWSLPLVLADPQRLWQILINLVGNGVKFTPEGGRVIIWAEAVDGQVVCHVEDNGIGISSQEQEIIFDKFRQLDSSLTRKHQGTGLGLALVKHLVQLHGGQLSLKSQLGQGSTFSFSLQLAGEDAEDREDIIV